MSVPPFSTLPLRAVQRSIDVVWSPQRPRPGLSVSLRIHIPHAERVTIVYPDDAELDERALRVLFSPLLRSIAAQHFPGILRELAGKHGFPMAPNIRIGAPRTRWASRSSTGTISLSYLMYIMSFRNMATEGFGLASAVGNVLGIFIIVFYQINDKIAKKWVSYD